LPFEVGSLVTIARRSITNALRNPETAISFHEISGKRSKSWEDNNTRTRNAASLPR